MLDLNEKTKKAMKNPNNWRTDSPDEPPCAICGINIKDDVPLRAFSDDGWKEIAFHIDCAIGGE